MDTELDELEKQLTLAYDMNFIQHLDIMPSGVTIHFNPKVTYKQIHKLVTHINRKYKNVAWVPGSLYLVNPNKRIKICYKRDHS